MSNLSMVKTNTLIQLIRNECANYFEHSGEPLKTIKNYCCLFDKSCVFFATEGKEENLPRCEYYEQSVLPLKPELELKYRRDRQLSTVELISRCKSCLKSFVPNSKNEKFCPECKTKRKKEQNKLSRKNNKRQ